MAVHNVVNDIVVTDDLWAKYRSRSVSMYVADLNLDFNWRIHSRRTSPDSDAITTQVIAFDSKLSKGTDSRTSKT